MIRNIFRVSSTFCSDSEGFKISFWNQCWLVLILNTHISRNKLLKLFKNKPLWCRSAEEAYLNHTKFGLRIIKIFLTPRVGHEEGHKKLGVSECIIQNSETMNTRFINFAKNMPSRASSALNMLLCYVQK